MSAQLREWSKYYQEATVAIKECYEEKIKLFGSTEDPYCSFESKGKTAVPASVGWTSWPDVTYPDIYNYLIVTPGMTHEQLKAYKSLDGFNFHINGKVNSVRVTELPSTTTYPKRYLFTALVWHSQTVSALSLRVWVGVKEPGEVICAHCTCMAGAGEVCAHVRALLFTAQGNTEMKRRQSCTSLPCSWLPPRNQFVPAIKVAEIDFKTPKSKQLFKLQSDELDATPSCKACLMTPPNTEQVNKLHVRLSNAVGKPVALSHTPGFSDAYVPLNTLADFPKPLTELFNRDAIDMSYQDLVEKCSDIYDNYVISCDQVSLVEKNTRQQAKSRIWFQQRAGRVTASKLKSAIATDVTKPSVSLIKSICYPDPTVDRFVSVACSYGLQYEDTARKEYMAAMKEVHIDFEINKSGLIIDPIYPFMGASPDGLICCTCCGHGVLEIKCPFSCKDKELRSVTDENSNFFLYSNDDGKLQLKRNHAYFYQVQMQIKFSQTKYCDFVVWRKDDLFIESIFPDINFIDNALTQAHAFIKHGVLLELVGKWFTKQSTIHVADSHTTISEVDEVDPYVEAAPAPLCCCQSTETEEDAWMIACNNEACVYKWFHYSCVGLTPQTIPDGDWYCPDCRV